MDVIRFGQKFILSADLFSLSEEIVRENRSIAKAIKPPVWLIAEMNFRNEEHVEGVDEEEEEEPE